MNVLGPRMRAALWGTGKVGETAPWGWPEEELSMNVLECGRMQHSTQAQETTSLVRRDWGLERRITTRSP